TERTEARGAGVEYLHRAGPTAHLAKPPEDMDAEAVVTLPGIPKAHDVEHGPGSHHQSRKGTFFPVLRKCTVQKRQASCERTPCPNPPVLSGSLISGPMKLPPQWPRPPQESRGEPFQVVGVMTW